MNNGKRFETQVKLAVTYSPAMYEPHRTFNPTSQQTSNTNNNTEKQKRNSIIRNK